MGTLFDNTFTPYNSLTIYDEIPEGLTYKSAKLVDKDGNDISSCGNLTYNYGTKTVAFDFNGDWLSDIKNNYKGQDLILRIDTTVNANAPATIKNIGHAVIDGADMPTNEVEIKVVKPVTYNVTHKFESGTQGKALPQAVIDLTPANQTGKLDGEAVAPTDFTPKEVKVSDGKWVFKGWDENSKTINGADVEFVGVWAFVKNTTIITDDPDPAKVTIEAKKTLNGKAPAGNTFTFVLKDENGKVVAAETNYGGSVIFDTMSFNNTGTYIYTLTEKTGGNKNIIYDKTEYTVIVKVTKPDDYYATVSYEKNGKPYKGTPLFVNTTKGTTTDTSGNSESDERPALPETGVNPNLFILLAITAVTSAAVVIKKHKA